MVQLLWKRVSYNMAHNPTILLLGIYPSEMKTSVHTKTHMNVYTGFALIIAKTWKQLKRLFN